ncbi:MAG: hypothetical protein DMF26_00970 [Verrucomicrobia bacterium]|nr:MAG: hypothetical protein DMF26_00970 [Verrucomicrobiota bacterium]
MHNAVIKVGETTPQRTWVSAGFRAANSWWAFCVVVFVTKLLLLWLDPTPKLFMGDSGAYIWTALTGWIPSDDRTSTGTWYVGWQFGRIVFCPFWRLRRSQAA